MSGFKATESKVKFSDEVEPSAPTFQVGEKEATPDPTDLKVYLADETNGAETSELLSGV